MTLRHFTPAITPNEAGERELAKIAPEVLRELLRAEQPLLIYGWGLRLAGCIEQATELSRILNIPVAATWAVRDAFPEALCFGTHGTKAGNLAVQNADYILSIGSRLDTKATSSPVSLFAPNAKLVMVDIDEAELRKMARFERPLHRSIQADCRDFFRHILYQWFRPEALPAPDRPWNAQVRAWTAQHKPKDTPPKAGFHAPYDLVERLSDLMTGEEVIVSDTGNTLGWLMQAFKFKGQRFLHPFNNTPMGYGLPGALGASLATGKRVVCITGDGSIMMSIGELATISKHCQDVKVLLLNNGGHGMCRYTQKQWLGGRFAGTGDDLAFPDDFPSVARWMGNWLVFSTLDAWWNSPGCAFLEVMIDPDASLAFQVRFGRPLEECDVSS